MSPPPAVTAGEIPLTVSEALGSKPSGFAWLKNGGVVKLNLMLLLFQVSSYATGFDGSMMNGLQSLDTWQAFFNNPSPPMLGLLNAIQNVGQLVALPFCAYACDKFGRRPVLVASAGILLLGTALQGAAQNVGMFIGARAVIGFGLAFNITAAPLLLLELAYPGQHGPMVGIYNSLWNLGALSAAWITFGTFRIGNTWAWRIPSLLQGVSSIVQVGLCWLAEESPRWLISVERDAEARRILTKYHANGNEADPIVTLEMEEIRVALQLEAEANRTTSYFAFLTSASNRKRVLLVLCVGFFSQWSGNGVISYYLSLILTSIGYKSSESQTLLNALLTVWGMIWSLFFSTIVNRFGRRTMFLASTIGMFAVYVTWTALQATYEQRSDADGNGPQGYAKGVLAMIFLYGFFFAIGWTPLQVTYVMEILPFNMRARGLVLYNFFVALALIFNQYVNPIGVTDIKWKFYIVYDVWLFVEILVIYFFFVETGGRSLEETAVVLDGEETQSKLVEVVGQKTMKGVEGGHDVTVEPVASKEV